MVGRARVRTKGKTRAPGNGEVLPVFFFLCARAVGATSGGARQPGRLETVRGKQARALTLSQCRSDARERGGA